MRKQVAILLGLCVGCSAVSLAAEPPAPKPSAGAQQVDEEKAKGAEQISTKAMLGLVNHLANCLRSDATALIASDGTQLLQMTFSTKQSTGYCGCKSALVRYIVRAGEPVKPPDKPEYEKKGEFSSMNADKVEVTIRAPLPYSPSDFYGVEISCRD